jgi:hypothetical protein
MGNGYNEGRLLFHAAGEGPNPLVCKFRYAKAVKEQVPLFPWQLVEIRKAIKEISGGKKIIELEFSGEKPYDAAHRFRFFPRR